MNGRVSILSQISYDLDFNLVRGIAFLELGLDLDQRKRLNERHVSSFAAALLYCSAIDLMARVLYKRMPVPKKSENGKFFKKSAKKLVPFSQAEKQFYPNPNYADIEPPVKGSYEADKSQQAGDMWGFRNALSHSYSLKNFEISTSPSTKLIEEKPGDKDTKIIFIRYMPASLGIAIEDLEKRLLNESEDEQSQTAAFIEEYGFVAVHSKPA